MIITCGSKVASCCLKGKGFNFISPLNSVLLSHMQEWTKFTRTQEYYLHCQPAVLNFQYNTSGKQNKNRDGKGEGIGRGEEEEEEVEERMLKEIILK